MKASILLVEDDINLGFVTKDNLEVNDYQVTLCEDGEIAWHIYQNQHFDLCIIDIMLPKLDGISLVEKIRQQDEEIPVIFLTAKAMKEDKITGFKAGADDYITKPFSIEELIFRIEVFLKRSSFSRQTRKEKEQEIYQIGSYQFDYRNQILAWGEQEKKLTQKEAALLKMFCTNTENILKREEILLKIWGNDDYFVGRSLDVFISRLRKYLKEDPSIEINNYHSVGFKLEVKA
ncbi:MAG: response regulator transcription factor [Candidatus Cyclobacteriaceae bacterium M3_2C_046]